jgi:Right handed beta helix region
MRSALGLGLAAVIAFMTIGATTASATHVQCGDVITQDTTLDSDVICPGESYGVTGVTIAADGVTLELAGHQVRGQNSFEDATSNGIATDGHRSGLVIRGGTVIGFSTGVSLMAAGSTVQRMALYNGSQGLSLRGDDNVVRYNDVRNTGDAGMSIGGAGVKVDRNVVVGPLSCLLVRGEDPRVTRNELSSCDSAGGVSQYTSSAVIAHNAVSGSASGLFVIGDGARIEHNDFSGNEVYGLSLSDGHAVLNRNVANDNVLENYEGRQGTGLEIHVAGAVVSRNRANRNGNLGIDAVPGTIDGGGNRASGNGNPAQCVGVSFR